MISIILQSCGPNEERRKNLEAILYCLEQQTYKDWEVILVEQSLDGNFYNKDFNCHQYIPIKDVKQRGVNRSWGRNAGGRVAKGDRLLFLDADIVFGKHYLEAITSFKGDPFFIASNYIIWSTQEEKETYLKNRDAETLLKSVNDRYESNDADSPINVAVCFERDWFFNTFGGFLENFFKWGFEDAEALDRIMKALGKSFPELHVLEKEGVAHLYHENRDRRWDFYNKNIFDYFRKFDDPIVSEAIKAANPGNLQHPSPLEPISTD